jgi:hypothetical protein
MNVILLEIELHYLIKIGINLLNHYLKKIVFLQIIELRSIIYIYPNLVLLNHIMKHIVIILLILIIVIINEIKQVKFKFQYFSF